MTIPLRRFSAKRPHARRDGREHQQTGRDHESEAETAANRQAITPIHTLPFPLQRSGVDIQDPRSGLQRGRLRDHSGDVLAFQRVDRDQSAHLRACRSPLVSDVVAAARPRSPRSISSRARGSRRALRRFAVHADSRATRVSASLGGRRKPQAMTSLLLAEDRQVAMRQEENHPQDARAGQARAATRRSDDRTDPREIVRPARPHWNRGLSRAAIHSNVGLPIVRPGNAGGWRSRRPTRPRLSSEAGRPLRRAASRLRPRIFVTRSWVEPTVTNVAGCSWIHRSTPSYPITFL